MKKRDLLWLTNFAYFQQSPPIEFRLMLNLFGPLNTQNAKVTH